MDPARPAGPAQRPSRPGRPGGSASRLPCEDFAFGHLRASGEGKNPATALLPRSSVGWGELKDFAEVDATTCPCPRRRPCLIGRCQSGGSLMPSHGEIVMPSLVLRFRWSLVFAVLLLGGGVALWLERAPLTAH